MTKFINIFKTITKQGMKFYLSIKKSIDEFEIESQKNDLTMSSNQSFLDFSSNLNDYLSNIKKLFDLINKEIIEFSVCFELLF